MDPSGTVQAGHLVGRGQPRSCPQRWPRVRTLSRAMAGDSGSLNSPGWSERGRPHSGGRRLQPRRHSGESRNPVPTVIPAKAGIQSPLNLDSGLRRSDTRDGVATDRRVILDSGLRRSDGAATVNLTREAATAIGQPPSDSRNPTIPRPWRRPAGRGRPKPYVSSTFQ